MKPRKLTADQVKELRELVALHRATSTANLCKKFGICETTLFNYVNDRHVHVNWRHKLWVMRREAEQQSSGRAGSE